MIDTPAGAEDELAHAIVLADLSLLVIRPTFLDFAAAIRTADVLRRLRKPGLIVLNQAPVSRAGAEPPLVKKAHEALQDDAPAGGADHPARPGRLPVGPGERLLRRGAHRRRPAPARRWPRCGPTWSASPSAQRPRQRSGCGPRRLAIPAL